MKYDDGPGVAAFYLELGATIRRRRRELAISQVDLAAELGVSQPTVARFERGVSKPNALHLRTFVRVFELGLDELLAPAWDARDLCLVDVDSAIPAAGDLVGALSGTSPQSVAPISDPVK